MQMTYVYDIVDQDNIATDAIPGLSRVQKTMPLPLDPPSRDEWQNFKVIIVDLYIGQNAPLRELVSHMAFHHGFKATSVLIPILFRRLADSLQ